MSSDNVLAYTDIKGCIPVESIDIKVKFIRGFADKNRLQIMESIKDKEMTVSQIVDRLKGNQSNISQHLACLKGCGLVVGRQEGKYIYYSLKSEQVKQLLLMFDHVLAEVRTEVECCTTEIQRGG